MDKKNFDENENYKQIDNREYWRKLLDIIRFCGTDADFCEWCSATITDILSTMEYESDKTVIDKLAASVNDAANRALMTGSK